MPARIPLIHGGQVPLRQTGDYTARTPQLSAGDTGLGDALGAVGKLAGTLGPKLSEMKQPDTEPDAGGISAQDVTALLEGESAMTAASEKFNRFQKDNPDPELWSGGFDEVRKSVQEKMTALNQRLSPQGQKSLQSAYEGFEGRHIQTIGTQVLERRQEMAEQAVLGRTQQAVKAGDKPGFFAALRLALGAKILPQEKAAQVEAEGLQQFREADMKATGEKLTSFYKRGDFQGGRDLVTQMHARQELDEVQSGQLLGQVNYQEGRYTLGREMLKDPLTFREQTAKADARFKKLTGHDQQEMLNEAKKEISSRGYQEVLNAAAKIDSADLENIRLTKKVDKVTLQDLDAGDLRYAKPHLRDSLDYYLKVRQGEASFDRPEIYQTARSWVKGYEPGLDKSGDVRRDMEAWIDLNFDREQAVNLKTDLQQQAENPYEGVPVQRAFRLVDELASGLPPVPGDQPGHGVRLLRQGMTNERAAYADHVKRMLDRKNGSGELKSEDEALSLVRGAYTPEMRSLVHGGTARVPATLGDRLRNLPVQETGPDPRKPSAVYDPFETQRQNKTLPSATMSISPARAAQMAADQGVAAQDIARMMKKNWQDQTAWGRQHGGDGARYGMIRLDNDTEAVMSALKDHARQQTVEQHLPDPGQRRRLAEQIQTGGFDPERVTPEFLPVMRALREVEKDPAFEFKPEHIYAGQMNDGERRLANYSLRRAEDGQMDVWLDLPDGRTFPTRIPEVTEADFKTELERRKHAFAQAGLEFSEAQMRVSRHKTGGVRAEAVTQGRERAALSAAEQKMKQAQMGYEALRYHGKNLLLGESLRTELQKPEWRDKVGQYGGWTEVYKGMLNASISAGTLAARVTGDEEQMRRFAEASEMLDLAYEGGSRRRFEGGLWNDTISGLQRSGGEMLPYMAGGGLVRLGTSGLSRLGVQGAARELARQQAGRIGVGGMGMGAHATGSAYVDVTQRIRQAEADGDPERAQRLREGRDLFAVLTGATEVAVGRIGAIDAFQGVSRGFKGTSVELLKNTVEEPLMGVIQRGVLEPGVLDEHPDVAAPLAQEALSGLIMSGGMSGVDAGVTALAPRRSEAGGHPAPPQTSPATPGLSDVGATAGDARFMPPGSTSGAEGSGSTTVLENVPAGSQLDYDAEGRLTGATPSAVDADTPSPARADNGNESESTRLQFSQGQPSQDEVVNVHKRLAEPEDAFQFGKSKPASTSMQELAQAYSPKGKELIVTEKPDWHGEFAYEVKTHKGEYHIVKDMKKGEVYVSSLNGKSNTAPSGGGAQVYQLAQTYAHNNGLKFRADGVVSSIAQRRRMSQMISGLLRHGTSDHLDGSHEFVDPETIEWKTDIPGWKTGAHDHNLALLLRAEHDYVMQSARDRGIDLTHLTHDARTDSIINEHTGKPLAQRDLKSLVDRFESGDSGVGQATLLRGLVTGTAIRRSGPGQSLRPLHQDAQSTYGKPGDGKSDDQLVRVARGLYYSRSQKNAGSVSPRRVGDAVSGRPNGLATVVAETTRFLNKKLRGLIHEKTQIFSSLDELLNSDYARQHPFTETELAGMKTAEGFFDKSTGKTVIIAENVSLRPGESTRTALSRVILHERIGHDGLNTLLGKKGDVFRNRWEALQKQIPQTELDAIAQEDGYQNLAGNRDALALEWFARKAETDMSLLESQPLLKQMWETLKQSATDLLAKMGYDRLRGKDLDTQVREMMNRARVAAVKEKSEASGTALSPGARDITSNGLNAGETLHFSHASNSGRPSGPLEHADQSNLEDEISRLREAGADYPHAVDGRFRGSWKTSVPGRVVRLNDGQTGTITQVAKDQTLTVSMEKEVLSGIRQNEVMMELSADELAAEKALIQRLKNFYELKGTYDQRLKEIARSLPEAYPLLPPLKGAPRGLEKAAKIMARERAMQRERPVQEVLAGFFDILRGSIVVDSMSQVSQTRQAVLDAFIPGAVRKERLANGDWIYQAPDGRKATIADRFETPTKGGYSDLQIILEMKPGHFVEIQVHLPEMLAVKDGFAVRQMGVPEKYWPQNLHIEGFDPDHPEHHLYEEARALPDGSPEAEAIFQKIRECYRSAWAAYRRRTGGLQSGEGPK